MFHAEIRPAKVFKQIIESLKEVVNECTFECTDSQMQVQAIDSGHVSLVSLELTPDQFHTYHCERSIQLGVSIGHLSKMMRCSQGEDCVILSSDTNNDVLNVHLADKQEERVMDFALKLMEINSDRLQIPTDKYRVAVRMPSSEFARICRDIASFGDTVALEVTPDHVAFSASGEIGQGKILLKASKSFDSSSYTEKREAGVKDEEPAVKREGDRKRPMDEPEDVEEVARKRRRTDAKREGVQIRCEEKVTLQFALRYLTMFSKASALSDTVSLKLNPEDPLQVEFEIQSSQESDDKDSRKHKLGYLRYYLAPKLGDAGDEGADENADMQE